MNDDARAVAIAWSLLFAASALEVVWATALKSSNGFARPWPSLLCISAATASFALLSYALRTLPLSVGYAVWVGLGAAGAAMAGFAVFGESLSLSRVACIGLIVLGVAGLKLES